MNAIKVGLITVFSITVLTAGYLIFFPSIKPQGDTGSNDSKGAAKESKDYIPEKFPYVKGMRGEDIRKIRAVLGLPPTDVFDQTLEDTLSSKFGVTEITQSDYNFYANYVTANV
jgi:hypothetical protein